MGWAVFLPADVAAVFIATPRLRFSFFDCCELGLAVGFAVLAQDPLGLGDTLGVMDAEEAPLDVFWGSFEGFFLPAVVFAALEEGPLPFATILADSKLFV